MTPLDRFYIYIDPHDKYAQFKLDEGTSSVFTGSLKGSAKSSVEKGLSAVEEKFKRRMIIESQKQFNDLEPVLGFIHNNDALLDMMAGNLLFMEHVFDRLLQLKSFGEAIDKTAGISTSLLHKFTHFIKGAGFKGHAERVKDAYDELRDKLLGDLNADEIKNFIKSKDHVLRPYERLRISINILRISKNHNIETGESGDTDLQIRELSHFFKELWKGVYSKLQENRETAGLKDQRLENFLPVYEGLFDTLGNVEEQNEIRSSILKHIFDKAKPDEINAFLEGIDRCNKIYINRAKTSDDHLTRNSESDARLTFCLRNVPLKQYLSAILESDFNRDEEKIFSMALLLFVESIKTGDIDGILLARQFIATYESNEKIREVREAMILSIRNNVYGTNLSESITSKVRILDVIRKTLTDGELEIYKKNYESLYPIDPEAIDITPDFRSLAQEDFIDDVGSVIPDEEKERDLLEKEIRNLEDEIDKGKDSESEHQNKAVRLKKLESILASRGEKPLDEPLLESSSTESLSIGQTSDDELHRLMEELDASTPSFEELQRRFDKLSEKTSIQTNSIDYQSLEERFLKLILPNTPRSSPDPKKEVKEKGF